MSRRIALPGAEELFKVTAHSASETPPVVDPEQQPLETSEVPMPQVSSRRQPVKPTGRTEHTEKITLYLSQDELLDLEQVRLDLRAMHSIGVDRGRIIREMIHITVGDFFRNERDSRLVHELKEN